VSPQHGWRLLRLLRWPRGPGHRRARWIHVGLRLQSRAQLSCAPVSAAALLLVATASASLVYASASSVVDAVPTRHGVAHVLAIIGPAALVSTGVLGSPSSLLSLPPTVALTCLVEQTLLDVSEDLLCSPADLDDAHLSPEVLLHITYLTPRVSNLHDKVDHKFKRH
jgi:hypothetical protein